jgi:hypothetical protein
MSHMARELLLARTLYHILSRCWVYRYASLTWRGLRWPVLQVAGLACVSFGAGCSSRSNASLVETADAAIVDAGVVDATGYGCRTSADCSPLDGHPYGWEYYACVGPNQSYHCGPTSSLGELCVADWQCGAGNVCSMAPGGAEGGVGLVCIEGVACTLDSQCGAGNVCRESGYCKVPCTSVIDCAPTERCESAGHCQAQTCAECPSYFACTNGTCSIPTCAADSDCPGGYCVYGSCAGTLGTCQVECF